MAPICALQLHFLQWLCWKAYNSAFAKVVVRIVKAYGERC